MINIDDSACIAPLDLVRHAGSERLSGQRRCYHKQARRGRFFRSVAVCGQDLRYPLDISATLQAAVIRQGRWRTLPLALHADDLRQKTYRQLRKGLIVFVVDASESMGEGSVARMSAAKGALLGFLTSAYQKRDQVALVAFHGDRAEVLLNPTSSIFLARQCLRKLPVGGATPFADGLVQARQVIRCACQKDPGLEPLLVIVSDGEANVPLVAGHDVYRELECIALSMKQDNLKSVVVDSSTGVLGNKHLQRFGKLIGGQYHHVRDLHAGRLFELLRSAEEIG